MVPKRIVSDTLYGEEGNDTLDAANYPSLVADNLGCARGDEDNAIADPLDAVVDTCENVVRIEEKSSDRVKGYFDKKDNPTHLEFDSYVDNEEGGVLLDGHPYDKGTSSVITLDDDTLPGDEPRIRLKLTVNPEKKTIRQQVTTPEGSQKKLSDNDKQAINKAGNLVADFLDSKNRDHCNIKNEETLVLRHFNLLAEANKHMELNDLERTYEEPPNKCGSNQNGSSTSLSTANVTKGMHSIATGCPAYVSKTDESARAGTNRFLGRDGAADARVQYVPLQSAEGDGVTILPCGSTSEVGYYTDAYGNPYTSEGVFGPGTDSPNGQCGPGNTGTVYTQDCLDHDVCNQELDVFAFDPFFNDCSDEFQAAVDDFALAEGAIIGGYSGPNCSDVTEPASASYREAVRREPPTAKGQAV